METEIIKALSGLVTELHIQGPWMAWNVALAALPVVGAVLLYLRRGHRGWLWWAGMATVVAFLPNTPYLVTDLIHLHADFQSAPTAAAAIAGVLPLFGTLVIFGFVGYVFCLRLLRRALREAAVPALRRRVIEAGVHGACIAGIALGRVARLNSWDVLRPSSMASGLVRLEASPILVYVALVMLILVAVALDRLLTVLLTAVGRQA